MVILTSLSQFHLATAASVPQLAVNEAPGFVAGTRQNKPGNLSTSHNTSRDVNNSSNTMASITAVQHGGDAVWARTLYWLICLLCLILLCALFGTMD